ncbi:hypothetical protein T01_8387 [Trichinella spiralis]|uniref:Uncharacterized protein n=1 Tax=Trichinella spiralis TaxID=6334 RepID=A0A0V1BE04_TRISP|nr:hypothetical protein T01_8387 [Trichinella spiralis]
MTYRSAESSKTTFSGIRTCGRFHCRALNGVWVRRYYHHHHGCSYDELDTGYTQTNTSTISGIRTCGRLHCRFK